jgi:4-methyl-5(b-hydroxyethyl)-thiazole monophosphate biosynthesis
MQKGQKARIFVLLAPGFEENDVITVTRTLRRLGFPVALVGLTAGPLRGSYGLSLAPDGTLSDVEAEQPQVVVLPGGVQGARQLNADPRVHVLLRQVVEQGGYVLALDIAYMVLQSAGVLGGTEKDAAEGSPSRWPSETLPSERVFVDGQVVFGRESGAAQESALTLAALLENRGTRGWKLR